ncbi:MAG: hypothetical protein ACFBSF_11985 [Leptolyngbyaceae cyanobacterium]
MFSLRHLASYLLAAATLGCLSASTLSETAERVQTRLVSGQQQSESAIAYRGTGRYSEPINPTLAHRGSGRVDNDTTDANDVAYRGSGRISTDGMGTPLHIS